MSETLATAQNPLMLTGEQSDLFWNVDLHRANAARLRHNFEEAEAERARAAAAEEDGEEKWHDASEGRDHLEVSGGGRPGRDTRLASFVSRLSIERSVSPSSSRSGSVVDGGKRHEEGKRKARG